MEEARRLGNRPWHVEQYGIDVVPEYERMGRAWDLFWIWFGANLGILALIYGAILVSLRLNVWQGLLVMGTGTASFLLVGVLSVVGRDGRAPMMTLSRAVFGIFGNVLPNFISWISLVGWEIVSVVTGTWALSALLGLVIPGDIPFRLGAALLIMVVATTASSLLGQATLVVVQKNASYLFGLLSMAVVMVMVPHVDWTRLCRAPAAPWSSAVLPAWALVFAGTGLSWANAAADYSRYLPSSTPKRSIIMAITCGAGLPLLGLMAAGFLVALQDPALATAANPIAAIGHILPSWMRAVYLLTAAGGLVVEANLSLYSSGLNLQAMFVPYPRYQTVLIDMVLMISGTVYVVFSSQHFLGPFESFILVLGIALAAWCGVFLAYAGMCRARGFLPSALYRGEGAPAWRWEAVLGWGLGTGFGMLSSTTPWFRGPWAKGIFSGSSLGLVGAFLLAALFESLGLAFRSAQRAVEKRPA